MPFVIVCEKDFVLHSCVFFTKDSFGVITNMKLFNIMYCYFVLLQSSDITGLPKFRLQAQVTGIVEM